MNDVKSGYKTSEYWISIVTNFVMVICFMLPVFGVQIENAEQIAAAFVAIITNVMYIWSRVKIKTAVK